jgi:hypothetical protein
MKIKIQEKNKAFVLRAKGYSFREISEVLNISKSTASIWTRNVKLSKQANKRIEELSIRGRQKAANTNWQRRVTKDEEILKKVKATFADKKFSKFDLRIFCALLYWCEGSKHKRVGSVSFMNSDPKMIKYFLYTLRKSFNLDEKKFRGLIHLHEYHDPQKQLDFWSKITKIPKKQFNNPYLKSHTGKNKRSNYPGCLSIRYYDNKIYKELIFIITTLLEKVMRV